MMAQSMDEAEQRAADYLLAQGYSKIVFEPDGNVPPDFCLDSGIAVEVRRLNQTFADEGLNELAIPLSRKLKIIMSSFGQPVDGRSWYVFWRFKRPLPQWKTLRKEIQRALGEFRSRATRDDQVNLIVTPGLDLRLTVASIGHKDMFVPGGYTDRQSGGFLLAEMGRCIQDHVNEKTLKIAPYRSRYPEWWLSEAFASVRVAVDAALIASVIINDRSAQVAYVKREKPFDKLNRYLKNLVDNGTNLHHAVPQLLKLHGICSSFASHADIGAFVHRVMISKDGDKRKIDLQYFQFANSEARRKVHCFNIFYCFVLILDLFSDYLVEERKAVSAEWRKDVIRLGVHVVQKNNQVRAIVNSEPQD
jgi:hypothetical protein